MRAEDMQKMLKQQPFKPFRIYMSDGSRYDIKHPEVAFLTRHYMEVLMDARPTNPGALATRGPIMRRVKSAAS